MSFGDGGNDVSMLRHTAIGVAMGNATPEVQQYANYVTAHIDDDGVQKALQHFGVID
jgi:hydroxymethylpyrimidine pyrophosphatase-like HAD family hydrolase